MIYKNVLACLFALNCTQLCGQASYSGFVAEYPIELLISSNFEGNVNGIYVYVQFDEPITLEGYLSKNMLFFHELNMEREITATLKFENFLYSSIYISGIWKDLNSGRELKITLKKEVDIGFDLSSTFKDKEIIQSTTLKDYYFKLLISKQKDEGRPTVTGIKIFEKRTDKILPYFNLNCELHFSCDNLDMGDFNFDGYTDFSVYQGYYGHTNFRSVYFLYDPIKHVFYDSNFVGINLRFDYETKLIFENSAFCVGTEYRNATYKVMDNKMVLLEEHCTIYDEQKMEWVEKPCR